MTTPQFSSLDAPLTVWEQISEIVGDHLGPVDLLALSVVPHPMLALPDGTERTVVQCLDTGDNEAVYALLRWVTTYDDEDAPRVPSLP